MPHQWSRTNKTLPNEGDEVIAVVRHHPKDRTKKVSYTYCRAIFKEDRFLCAGMALHPVCKWMLAADNKEIPEAQDRQVMMFKL